MIAAIILAFGVFLSILVASQKHMVTLSTRDRFVYIGSLLGCLVSFVFVQWNIKRDKETKKKVPLWQVFIPYLTIFLFSFVAMVHYDIPGGVRTRNDLTFNDITLPSLRREINSNN